MKNKKVLIISVLAILSLVLITIGATVAFFSYIGEGSTDNTIESGSINFIYEEVNKMGNGISIVDAMPISDSEGKASNNYFDFKVTSSTGTTIAIPYEITARVSEGSDDLSDYVKLYLTKVNGTNEQQVALSIYSDLNDSTNTLAQPFGDKTLYNGEIPVGATDYTENYRLRMWLNDNPTDGSVLDYSPVYACSDTTYTNQTDCESNNGVWNPTENYNNQNKTFSIKVNVYANGEQASQQKIESATTTDITGLKINNTLATESTNSTDNYDYYVEASMDNSNNIEIIPLNEEQTYTVENITEQEANTIKGVSTKQDLNLVLGDNYLKVTVIAANKVNTKDYIVKVKLLEQTALISMTPRNEGKTSEIEFDIDYLGHTNPQYKVGNGAYKAYNGKFTLTSDMVKDYKDADGNVELYVKAIGANNVVLENTLVIDKFDFDYPNAPVITATATVPTLTLYGVELQSNLSVVYDSRNDVVNEISLNNGQTWTAYTGNEILTNSTIMARSRKVSSGLTTTSTKTVSTESGALDISAYNGNMDDYTSENGYIMVDSSAVGQKMYMKNYSNRFTWYTKFYNSTNQELLSYESSNNEFCSGGYKECEVSVTIPEGTTKIVFNVHGTNGEGIGKIYEVNMDTRPTYNVETYYPMFKSTGVTSQDISITYAPTAVTKYYQVVPSGGTLNNNNWVEYPNTSINFAPGSTLYAKSVNQYGADSMITKLEMASNALDPLAYNENSTDYATTEGYIMVDSSLIGKTLYMSNYTDRFTWFIYFQNSSNKNISSFESTNNGFCSGGYKNCTCSVTIPANAAKIRVALANSGKMYEMSVSD